MSRRARELVLAVVAVDRTFEKVTTRGETLWVGRCIHCNSKLAVGLDGTTAATLEHIVPTTHGGQDSVDNLALACARCNHLKGSRLDARRADDPKLREVIDTLRARKAARARG